MKTISVVVSVCILLVSATAQGAECALKPEDLNVRKSFVYSEGEQNPARLAVQQVAGDKNNTALADIGARITTYDCGDYRFSPVIEYHRDTSPTKPVNNVSGGVKILAEPSWLDYSASANYTGVLDITPSYKKDTITGISSASMAVMIYGSKIYGFSLLGARLKYAATGADGKTIEESLKLQTIPYLGIDYYSKLPQLIANVPSNMSTVEATYLAFRYYLEYWPGPHFYQPGFQLLANVNYRESIGGDGLKNPKSVGLSLNYYIDKQNRLAIGIDYEKGNIQTADFVESEKTSLFFKAKF